MLVVIVIDYAQLRTIVKKLNRKQHRPPKKTHEKHEPNQIKYRWLSRRFFRVKIHKQKMEEANVVHLIPKMRAELKNAGKNNKCCIFI